MMREAVSKELDRLYEHTLATADTNLARQIAAPEAHLDRIASLAVNQEATSRARAKAGRVSRTVRNSVEEGSKEACRKATADVERVEAPSLKAHSPQKKESGGAIIKQSSNTKPTARRLQPRRSARKCSQSQSDAPGGVLRDDVVHPSHPMKKTEATQLKGEGQVVGEEAKAEAVCDRGKPTRVRKKPTQGRGRGTSALLAVKGAPSGRKRPRPQLKQPTTIADEHHPILSIPTRRTAREVGLDNDTPFCPPLLAKKRNSYQMAKSTLAEAAAEVGTGAGAEAGEVDVLWTAEAIYESVPSLSQDVGRKRDGQAAADVSVSHLSTNVRLRRGSGNGNGNGNGNGGDKGPRSSGGSGWLKNVTAACHVQSTEAKSLLLLPKATATTTATTTSTTRSGSRAEVGGLGCDRGATTRGEAAIAVPTPTESTEVEHAKPGHPPTLNSTRLSTQGPLVRRSTAPSQGAGTAATAADALTEQVMEPKYFSVGAQARHDMQMVGAVSSLTKASQAAQPTKGHLATPKSNSQPHRPKPWSLNSVLLQSPMPIMRLLPSPHSR